MATKPPLRKTLSVTADKDKKLPEFKRRKSSVKVSAIQSLTSHFEHSELRLPEDQNSTGADLDEPESNDPEKTQDSWTEFTGIHLSARKGDIKQIEQYLKDGIDPNLEDETGRTPLSAACDKGQVEAAQLLISSGATVDHCLKGKGTVLHMAVASEDEEMVKFLLGVGADVAARENDYKSTPLHFATFRGQSKTLQTLLDFTSQDQSTHQKILHKKDKKGRTALHLAAGTGNNDAVRTLLASGSQIDCTDDADMTPLHSALLSHKKRRRCFGTLSAFMECGANMNVKDINDETLVHWTARVGCTFCLEALIKHGLDLSAKDKNGRTCLHIAALAKEVEAFKYLLTKGMDPKFLSSKGQSALHMSILADSPTLIEICVKAGCSITPDISGLTPIQFAFINRKNEAFQTLVRMKVIALPEGSGEDLIHYCSSLGSILCVNFLLEEGWDINKKDSKRRTPLHLSLLHGNEPLTLALINKGSDLSFTDDAGATPLHYAVRWCGSDAVLRLMLKKQVDLEATDRLGRTPLHYAASKFSVMSDLYILLDGKPKLDAQDDMGLTPLHLAARFGNESLVRILLDQGAKHDLVDIDDFQPIDHAKEKNHKSIQSRLLKYHTAKLNNTKADKKISPIAHRNSLSW